MRFVRLLLPALLLAACAPENDKAYESSWQDGKGDGRFELTDRGPLRLDGQPQRVQVDGVISAFRVQSFGKTRVDIDAHGLDGADAYMIVEGPLDKDGDVPVGSQAASGRDFAGDDDGGPGVDARLQLTLDAPGVYRVIVGTYQSLGLGERDDAELALTARCTERCFREQIPAKEFFTQLRASGKLDLILAGFEQKLAEKIPDATTRELIMGQLRTIAATSDFAGLDRFPTIPLALLPEVRPMLGLISSEPPHPDEVVTGSLGELLGPCTPTRARPPGLSPALPEIGMEQFPNLALSACQAAHSHKLARLLTALAAGNGSWVEYKGARYETPAELADGLQVNGHRIEVANERMYANFLSFTYGDYDVKWPTWLETGVVLPDGSKLTVPMGHSHHAWTITGPDVNTTVMFYLGISGAGFWGKTGIRAAWSGFVAHDVTDNRNMVRATLEAATTYFQRTRLERDTVAQGMPIDGYGYVGVCNDSNAIIEKATRGTVTTYPLMRAKALDAAADLGDGLDADVKSLPNDADVAESDEDIIRRVLLMTPHELDSPNLPDETLRGQLKAAQRLHDAAQR
jgi:hypothetical protein